MNREAHWKESALFKINSSEQSKTSTKELATLTPNAPMSGAEARSAEASAPLAC
jgi:hypothetical protein